MQIFLSAFDDIPGARRSVYIIFAMLALSSFGFFAVFPYLTLYITLNFDQTPARAGAIVGSVTIVASLGAWLGGLLVDRFGKRLVLVVSSLIFVACFITLCSASTLSVSISTLLAIGFSRALMEPAIKAALVQFGGASGRLFRIRYLTFAISASLAPLCVAFVPMNQFSLVFLAVTFLYAGCLFLALMLTEVQNEEQPCETKSKALFTPNWKSVALVLASGFLFFCAFSQFETTLPLHLVDDNQSFGAQYYRYALVANALLAVSFALVIEMRGWDTTRVPWILLGVFSLSASALCIYLGVDLWIVALGVALFTVGEVLLYPLPEIYAARIAQPGAEGRLMGLLDLRYFGFFAGPVLGGFALGVNSVVLAFSLAFIALSILPIFLVIRKRAMP